MNDASELLTFAKKYMEMRRRQREYFAKKVGLEDCKRIEKELDAQAERIVIGIKPGLFDEAEGP